MNSADPLLFVYASAELILALHISLSNFVVILVYLRSKHIRTPTNAYIFSLAMTDFLAGALGIPFTVASVLTRWPGSYYACLAIHLVLCVLCTVSTLHLLAMAVDKYLTICLKRFDHQRTSSTSSIRKTRANFLIISAWISGAAIAGLPMVDGFGFSSRTIGNFRGECHFTVVVDYRYLVFVIFFGTIILPSVIIAFCYMAIYAHIRREERQIKCLLRASERQRRINARRKLIRILLILVLTYAICWYPLYLINTADLFLPPQFHAGRTLTLAAVVLSHLNCALNPLIYAYGVPGFKHSLRRFLPIKAAANCSQNTPYTGTVPMPKSPFIGHSRIPMGIKRQVVPGTDPMVASRKMPSAGKFSRAISTVNTVAPHLMSVPPPPLTVQQSSQSLLETRREQFHQRRHPTSGDSKGGDSNSCQLQNSTTTETEERWESGLEEKPTTTQNSSEGRNSIESILSEEGDGPISADSAGEERRRRKRRKQSERTTAADEQKRRGESVVSKMSAWSVRIFNGQWLVRSRKMDTGCGDEKQRLGLLISGGERGKEGERLVTGEEEQDAGSSSTANGARNE